MPETRDRAGESKNPCHRLRDSLADEVDRFSPTHEWMKRNLAFGLDLRQWDDDRGNTRRASRVQPRDPGPWRVWAHNMGLTFQKAPIHVTCRPIDEFADPARAEDIKAAIEWEVENPQKRFKDVRRRYVGGALACGAWGAAWDYYPERGPFGEIFGRAVEPWNLMWADGFLHPQDPMCPWIDEVLRVPIDQLLDCPDYSKKAKELLKPDDGFQDTPGGGLFITQSGNVGGWSNETSPHVRSSSKTRLVTVVKRHYRFDPDGSKAMREADYRELLPAERYMACVGLRGQGCGFQSDSQRGLNQELPKSVEGGCPDCRGNLKRVDAEARDEEALLYPDGKLLVTAPFCAPDVPLYYDQWQVKCRAFPYLYLIAHPVPHKVVGQCSTSLAWTNTVAKNGLVRSVYEITKRSKPFFGAPKSGLEDPFGKPFQFREDQGDYFQWSTEFATGNEIKILQGAGVNPSVFQVIDYLDKNIEKNKGTSDVSFAQGESRNIAASSLELQLESGNVPVNDFMDVLYGEESLHMGNLADFISATYTMGRVIRMRGPAGVDTYKRIHGRSLPAVDVLVSSGPSLTTIRREQVENFQQLAAIPAPMRKAFAKYAGVDPSILRDLEDADRQMEALAAQQAQKAAMTGVVAPPAQPGRPSPQSQPTPRPQVGAAMNGR